MQTSLIVLVFLSATMLTADALSGDATWYNVQAGTTACGTHHSNIELIGAVAPNWWSGGNPNNDVICRKSARVTDPQSGRSVTVRIKDKCMGCQYGDIDLSPSAFSQLRPQNVGRFRVNWDFV